MVSNYIFQWRVRFIEPTGIHIQVCQWLSAPIVNCIPITSPLQCILTYLVAYMCNLLQPSETKTHLLMMHSVLSSYSPRFLTYFWNMTPFCQLSVKSPVIFPCLARKSHHAGKLRSNEPHHKSFERCPKIQCIRFRENLHENNGFPDFRLG